MNLQPIIIARNQVDGQCSRIMQFACLLVKPFFEVTGFLSLKNDLEGFFEDRKTVHRCNAGVHLHVDP